MTFREEVPLLIKPYYWINILLSLSYILIKRTPLICDFFAHLFPIDEKCEFGGRDTEILFFLIIVIMIRTRKAGSTTMIAYLTSSFLYCKVANLILWSIRDIRFGIGYGIIIVLIGLLFSEPTYNGPEEVTYFRTQNGLDEELERDKRVNWLVVFYTVWNPACVNFAPVFAKLSASYGLNNLRFGKVDIGRFPELGKKFHVSDSSLSRQLPTLILFQNGKEVSRRPTADHTGKLQKFFFSEDNVRAAFDLNNLYKDCKANPIVKKTAIEKKKE